MKKYIIGFIIFLFGSISSVGLVMTGKLPVILVKKADVIDLLTHDYMATNIALQCLKGKEI